MALQIQSAKVNVIVADDETGEITEKEFDISQLVASALATKKTRTSSSKVKIDDSNPIPTLTLLENKYQLNKAAVDLMGIEPDMKLDIKYEKRGKVLIPVIGREEALASKKGNRVTKSFTVSYRGKNHDTLATYGESFEITPHDKYNNQFILKSGEMEEIEPEVDLTVEVPSIDDDLVDIDDSEDVLAGFDLNL